MTEDQARALFNEHREPGDLAHYGEKAAVAAILSLTRGWQPIATIPTDGTEVLAAIKVSSVTGSSWWERHFIAIDDETGEVLDSLYGGWDRNDYSHSHALPDYPVFI